MSRKTTNIIFCLIILAAIAGVGIGVYVFHNHGQVVGRIEFGTKYYLTEIRPTERFAGATMDQNSYFQINHNQKTGKLYLAGLTATSAPISFIVTDYQEGTKATTIEFEYIIGTGDKTKIQHLQAISTQTEIRIKAIESHDVQNIITENPETVKSLDYLVTILVFSKEAA